MALTTINVDNGTSTDYQVIGDNATIGAATGLIQGGLQMATGTVTTLVQPTISTTAYTALDQVGTVMTFPTPGFSANRLFRILSIVIVDLDNEKAALNLLLFRNNPTVTSVDNGALNITDANLVAAEPIAVYSVTTAMYVNVNSAAFGTFAPNMGATSVSQQTFMCGATNAVYGLMQAVATPTYSATNDLRVQMTFQAL